MTHFTLDALNAGKGDALVLTWGAGKGHIALIDGGPSTVYADAILPHLQALAGTNPVGTQNPVIVDLVVVSHVDDDHINGIIDLANAIDTAQKQLHTLPAKVAEVWHNAFADMQFLAEFADEPDLQQAIRDADAAPAALHGETATPKDDPTVDDITAGAQSVAQGRQLDRILKTINVSRNASFADREDFARSGPPLDVHGLRVTVLAPNTALLDKLRTEWRKELKKLLKRQADKKTAGVRALAAAFDDPSIPNQSSIVLLVEFDGKSMLLTGDARGDHIIRALNDDPNVAVPLNVDLFKVPHHGSDHSNGTRLFQTVIADHYVISGNGEHGNPHPDALEALFTTQAGRSITVHLTNRPTIGAKKPADKKKAQRAQKVLDDAAGDPNTTIVYRDDPAFAVSVPLL